MSQFASDVYVYDAVRTPKGRVKRDGGTLADVPAYELLATLLRALGERGLDTDLVEDVVIGTSTAAGEQGGDVARAAALWAGWPDTVPGGVVSRLCCSGLDAIGTATAKVASGMNELVVAGGVESMSRVPMLVDKPAFAFEGELQDRTGYVTIGVAADLTAADAGFTRADLDAYAVSSHLRSAAAPPSTSIIPLVSGGSVTLAHDEGARSNAAVEGFASLPTLFAEDPSWERVARQLPDSRRPTGGLHTVGTAPPNSPTEPPPSSWDQDEQDPPWGPLPWPASREWHRRPYAHPASPHPCRPHRTPSLEPESPPRSSMSWRPNEPLRCHRCC